jgi:rubrerythrin
MLPSNLSPLEIFDLALHNETLTLQTYDRLSRRVDVATLQAKLALLRRDEKDHRKTLRAHRRALFGSAAPSATRTRCSPPSTPRSRPRSTAPTSTTA